MPVKLAKLPETFGLPVQDKGWFPYLFNRPENFGFFNPHKNIYSFIYRVYTSHIAFKGVL